MLPIKEFSSWKEMKRIWSKKKQLWEELLQRRTRCQQLLTMSSLTDEDETKPIANLIRNTDGVVDVIDKEKSKMKKQIGKNKDQATSMEGNWAKTKVRKTINSIYAPNIGHPTLAEEVGVKP
jgi:hypothetical protein